MVSMMSIQEPLTAGNKKKMKKKPKNNHTVNTSMNYSNLLEKDHIVQGWQQKLEKIPGVTQMVLHENNVASEVLDSLSNRELPRGKKKVDLDSSKTISLANTEFNTVKAMLSSIVASQDERIKELVSDCTHINLAS